MKHIAVATAHKPAAWLAKVYVVRCSCGFRCEHLHRLESAAIKCAARHEKQAQAKS